MKQQEQKNITNPMSRKRKKKSSDSNIGMSLLVGIPVIILSLAAFGYVFDIHYTVEKDPHAFVGGSLSQKHVPQSNRLQDTTHSHQQRPQRAVDDDEAVEDKHAINNNKKESLLVVTKYGNIRIVFRPDLAPESVDYVKQVASSEKPCQTCKFHRFEKDLLMQGVMKHSLIPLNTVFGKCPDPQFEVKDKSKCPKHDPNCGCHGPIMTKGMVGWAAGSAGGPDWFINFFHKPVEWWEHQHTVWGEVQDDESFQTLHRIQSDCPVHKTGGLNMLDEKIDFNLKLE